MKIGRKQSPILLRVQLKDLAESSTEDSTEDQTAEELNDESKFWLQRTNSDAEHSFFVINLYFNLLTNTTQHNSTYFHFWQIQSPYFKNGSSSFIFLIKILLL